MAHPLELDGLIRAMRQADPADVPEMRVSAAATIGGRDVVVYLVDFEQHVRSLSPGVPLGGDEEIPRMQRMGPGAMLRSSEPFGTRLRCRSPDAMRLRPLVSSSKDSVA